METNAIESIKIVIVGDEEVGKTCLLLKHTKNTFPDVYVPTVFDNFTVNMMFDKWPTTLSLWDTAGKADYDRLRPLSYLQIHTVLVCFSVVDPTSFDVSCFKILDLESVLIKYAIHYSFFLF